MNDLAETLFNKKTNKLQIKVKILLIIATITSIAIFIKNKLTRKI